MLDLKGTYYLQSEAYTVVYHIDSMLSTYIMSNSFFRKHQKELPEIINVNKEIIMLDSSIVSNHMLNDSIRQVSVEIVSKCDLNCKHCYGNFLHEGISVTKCQFDRILNEISTLLPCNVKITGGEPTLHPDIVEFCRKVIKLQPLTHHLVLTNATVSSAIFKAIIDSGIHVQISMYGFYFDSFQSFTNASRKLYDNIFENLASIPEYARDKIEIVYYDVSLSDDEKLEFVTFAKINHFKYHFGHITYLGRATENFSAFEKRMITFDSDFHKKSPTSLNCSVCEPSQLNICTNGDVTPCGYIRSAVKNYGNIFNCSMDEILSSSVRMNFVNQTINDVKGCSDCPIRYLCSGGCYELTRSVTGSFFNKYPYCTFDRFIEQIVLNQIYLVEMRSPGVFNMTPIVKEM